MSGGYLEGFWNVSVLCLEGTWNGSGMCQVGAWKICGRFLKGIWNVSGRLLESVGTMSGGYLEDVWEVLKSFCQFGEFWNVLFCSVFITLFFIKLHTELSNLTQLELNGVEVLRASEPSIYLKLFSVLF